MTLKQLEYFLAVAKTGHISSAAQELELSQPPVSVQIRLLEEELGVELFYRDKKKLIITPAGQLLKKKATQLLQMALSTSEEVQCLGQRMHGTVNLGVITSSCVQIVPAKAALLLQEHPDITFQLWEGTSLQIMEWLENGTCDIGLIREPYDHSLFNNYPIWDPVLGKSQIDPFVAVGMPYFMNFSIGQHEISLSDLADKPLILHRRYYQQIMGVFHRENLHPTVVCQNNDLVSSASWAAQGLGVAILPLTSALLRLGSHRLIMARISDPDLNTRLALITRKENRLSLAARMFIEVLGKSSEQTLS